MFHNRPEGTNLVCPNLALKSAKDFLEEEGTQFPVWHLSGVIVVIVVQQQQPLLFLVILEISNISDILDISNILVILDMSDILVGHFGHLRHFRPFWTF